MHDGTSLDSELGIKGGYKLGLGDVDVGEMF
jgi:hypothetical protein